MTTRRIHGEVCMNTPVDGEVTRIRPNHGTSHYWAELWQYRELFAFLAWRDLAVRYKQMTIGVLWALLRPLLTMVVFSVVFGRLAGLPSPGGVPFPLLVMAGLLPWQFFSAVMSEGSTSLLTNSHLITKVYFPRLIVPTSTVAVALADLLVAGGLMGVLMAWYRFLPPARVVLLPAFLLLGTAAALGVGFWLSTLTVRYRDFRYVVPFMVQFGLYLTPVGYSTASIPEMYRPLFALNPLVGVIEGFRWCLLGVGEVGPNVMAPSAVMAAVLLVSGFAYFRACERRFADTI